MGNGLYPHVYNNYQGLIKGEEGDLFMFPIGVEVLYPHAERNPGLVRPDVARAIYRADGTLVGMG